MLNKIPGFRSETPWKMILSTIFYSISLIFACLFIIVSIAANGVAETLWFLTAMLLLATLIIAIIGLVKGKIKTLHIHNRKTATLIFGISIVLFGILPTPETETVDHSEKASEETAEIEEKQERPEYKTETDSNNQAGEENAGNQKTSEETGEQQQEGEDANDEKSHDTADIADESAEASDSQNREKSSEEAAENKPSSQDEDQQTPGDVTATVTRVVDGLSL